MGRKPHYGEGSVFERKDGRYEAVVPNWNGTGKRKSFYGKTKTEARKKRDEALAKLARNEYVETDRQKTGEYLEYWASVHGNTTKLTTKQSYQRYLRIHFIPALGHIPLQKLTTQDIQGVIDQMLKAGKKASSIHTIHTVLHGALEYAVKIGKIAKNPCDNVKLPRREKRKQAILTADQARLLIDSCQELLSDAINWQAGAVILTLLTTGLRIGEALSLHWSDIDFEKKVMYVSNTLSYDKEERRQYESDPKSESSRREISLPNLAITTLSAHRMNQRELRARTPEWEDHNLVFTIWWGGHAWGTTFRKKFHQLCEQLDLPYMRLHDLRHNIATALLASGTPMKAVQGLLGHSKIGTTLDIYGHVTPEMKQSAADEIDRLFR